MIRRWHLAMTEQQRGMALIITLAVVALGSVMAVLMMERVSQSVVRTQALSNRAQVDVFTDGMALLAERRLSEWQAMQQSGTPTIDLSQWSDPYPVPGGVVQGRLIDLGGAFNLNALLNPDPNARAEARQVLERLFLVLNLDTTLAGRLGQWLLDRDRPTASRVESGAGFGAVGLVHLSELREWPMHQAAFETQWWRFVTVHPTLELRVNINQTTPELLVALLPNLDLGQAERVLMDRPFRDVDDLWGQPILQSLALSDQQRERLTSHSLWYLAQARVTLAGAEDHSPMRVDVFRLISASGSSSGYDFRYVSYGMP